MSALFQTMMDRAAWGIGLLNDYFRGLVHPSVRGQGLTAVRHASLIRSHTVGGIVAVLLFSGYFIWTGAFGAAAAIALLCFLSPLAIAVYLSRTGNLETAHFLSSAQLALIVGFAAVLTGGTQSFAIIWLALVPLEAALSANRRVMALATALTLAALIALHVLTTTGALPAPVNIPIDRHVVTQLTLIGAVAYACGLVSAVQSLHREFERDIETSRWRYQLIAENANDLITRHDADGAVTFASLASRSLLSRMPEELHGEGLSTLLANDDRSRFQAMFAACLSSRAPVEEEFQVTLADPVAGERASARSRSLWLEIRCQPVADLPGTPPTSVVAVSRDITARKREAEQLAEARDEAMRASRAKTAFLAAMSHELRTPLSAIIGFAELLHRELLIKQREPKHADYCRIIHQSGEHLLSLVRDLLDVSKIESGRFSVVSDACEIRDIARQVTESLRPQATAKGITLSLRMPADLPEVYGDRRAIRQILINLVSNACKFTGHAGQIEVGAEPAGDRMRLWVRDTGIGIAPENLERILQPFYQVQTSHDRQNDGVGLGLSIVKGLLDLQGGSLTVESKPGQGSCFEVTLPLDIESLDGTSEHTAPIGKRSGTADAEPKVIDLAEIHAKRRQRTESAATSTERAASAG